MYNNFIVCTLYHHYQDNKHKNCRGTSKVARENVRKKNEIKLHYFLSIYYIFFVFIIIK